MKIFIYGDSNTWGQVPSLETYSKDFIPHRHAHVWWSSVLRGNMVRVNGLGGRAIASDNKWVEGRNASKTIDRDLAKIKADLVILQLGTNDCKAANNLSAEQIAAQMHRFAKYVQEKTQASIMIVSPHVIKEGTAVTDRFYRGAEEKSKALIGLYKQMAKENGFYFLSAEGVDVGIDGEHYTQKGHDQLGKRVLLAVNKIKEKKMLEDNEEDLFSEE